MTIFLSQLKFMLFGKGLGCAGMPLADIDWRFYLVIIILGLLFFIWMCRSYPKKKIDKVKDEIKREEKLNQD